MGKSTYLIIHHINVLWVLYCYCKLLNKLEKLLELPKQSNNFSLLSKFIRLDLNNLHKAYCMKKRLLRKSVLPTYLKSYFILLHVIFCQMSFLAIRLLHSNFLRGLFYLLSIKHSYTGLKIPKTYLKLSVCSQLHEIITKDG